MASSYIPFYEGSEAFETRVEATGPIMGLVHLNALNWALFELLQSVHINIYAILMIHFFPFENNNKKKNLFTFLLKQYFRLKFKQCI